MGLALLICLSLLSTVSLPAGSLAHTRLSPYPRLSGFRLQSEQSVHRQKEA